MAFITFLKGPPILSESNEPLMQTLLRHGRPVASSCKGDGVCCKCVVQILEGTHHLSPMNETERFLKEKFQLNLNQRVSCQVSVLGDIKVHATYW